MRDKNDLKKLQALPLDIKVLMTKQRIREWVSAFGEDGVYVSFSGGKDSTVLLHIVREIYTDVVAVFVNTGLEYPETQQFVKTFDNVTILRPKMRFDEVIKKHGYPLIGKHQANAVSLVRSNLRDGRYTLRCRYLGIKPEEAKELGLVLPDEDTINRYERTACGSKFELPKYRPLLDADFRISEKCCDIMKKEPIHEYEKRTGKKPMMATMACESVIRESAWYKNGCNAFDSKRPKSTPMAFWTEQDVLQYIKENGIRICSVYGEIVENGPDGFEYETNLTGEPVGKLRTTGCHRTGCIFCAFGCHLEKGESRFEQLKRTHPRQYEYCIQGGGYDADGLWKPNEKGLGMGHVFDELNKIYGKNFIRY